MKRNVNFALRLPEDLHAELSKAAAASGHSMNTLALDAIRRSLQPPVKKVPIVDAVREVWAADFSKLEERVLAMFSAHPPFHSGGYVGDQPVGLFGEAGNDLAKPQAALSDTGRLSDPQPQLWHGVPPFHVPAEGTQPLEKGETVTQPEISGIQTLATLKTVTDATATRENEWQDNPGYDKWQDLGLEAYTVVETETVDGNAFAYVQKVWWERGHGAHDVLRWRVAPNRMQTPQHLTQPGALEWDAPGEGTKWRIHDGESPVGRFVAPGTQVEIERRRVGARTETGPASSFDWTFKPNQRPYEKHPDQIFAWRLAK